MDREPGPGPARPAVLPLPTGCPPTGGETVESDESQHLCHLADTAPDRDPGHAESECHVVLYIAVGKQGVVLKHEAHTTPVDRYVGEVLAAPADPARIRAPEPGHYP